MTDEDRISRAADEMREAIRHMQIAVSGPATVGGLDALRSAIAACEAAADEYDDAVEAFEISDERRRIICQCVGEN